MKIVMAVLCAALLTATEVLAQDQPLRMTTNYNPWCHTFNKSYSEVYEATLKAIKEESDYLIFDASKQGQFIYCTFRDAAFPNHSIRFVEEGKNKTRVISRSNLSVTSLRMLRLIGDAVGESLPANPGAIKFRDTPRSSKRLWTPEDMSKDCKEYAESL